MERAGRAYVLTARPAAAIAVVRIAGAGVAAFLEASFSRPALPGRCVHGELRDGDLVVDDPVIVLHDSGTIADLSLHGGPWVVKRCLDLLDRRGFEVIEDDAGPLPAEAVDADSEIEREVLQHLPLARTELALRVLLAQPAAWAELERRRPSAEELAAIAADRSLCTLLGLPRMPRVAIIGPPNVGKSTLANQLFAQERSITADVPGTTRDWVGEIANIDGLAVMLIDTPGQRPTDDPIEAEAIRRSRDEIESSELVTIVFDAATPSALVRELVERHPAAVLVRNKADLDAPHALALPEAKAPPLPTVATTGEGIDALRRAILGQFGCLEVDIHRPRPFTPRHMALLKRARDFPG